MILKSSYYCKGREKKIRKTYPVRRSSSNKWTTWRTVNTRGEMGGLNLYCKVQIVAVGETSLTLVTLCITCMKLKAEAG